MNFVCESHILEHLLMLHIVILVALAFHQRKARWGAKHSPLRSALILEAKCINLKHFDLL